MRAVSIPAPASAIAAVKPAGPPPTTTTSVDSVSTEAHPLLFQDSRNGAAIDFPDRDSRLFGPPVHCRRGGAGAHGLVCGSATPLGTHVLLPRRRTPGRCRRWH